MNKKIYLIISFSFILFAKVATAEINIDNKVNNTSIKLEDSSDIKDLFPKTSESIHNFNIKLLYTFKPSLDLYKQQKNNTIHKGLSNFFKNLKEPLTASNSLLQLDFSNTFNSLGRFVINSTIGLLGTIDIASKIGLKKDERDFGKTLSTWGMSSNGFFVSPLYAQTTTRDFTGIIVDSTLNPINFFFSWYLTLFINISSKLFDIYDGYELILSTHETSIDSYATFKTMYLQYRINEINKLKLSFKKEIEETKETENHTDSYDFDME